MRKILFAALMALFLLPTAAQATTGESAAALNVRSGPGYPLIGRIAAHQRVEIIGCARGWEWCDVQSSNLRGWVAAKYLWVYYNNARRGVVNFGPRVGVRLVDFNERDYWLRNYPNDEFCRVKYGTKMHHDNNNHDGWDSEHESQQGKPQYGGALPFNHYDRHYSNHYNN